PDSVYATRYFFFTLPWLPPPSTLFPYTTLFRSPPPPCRLAVPATRSSELVGLQDVAELTESPGEDAGDVHLGHADPLGDLGLGEVLVEPQVDHETVPLRQRLQRLVETGPIEHGREVVVDVPHQIGHRRARRWVGLVQRSGAVALADADRLGHLLLGHLQRFADLLQGRGPPRLLGPLLAHPGHCHGQLLQASRHAHRPAPVAQLALQLARYGHGGE